MADKQEIDKGVGAHGLWKMRLRNAVDSGNLEVGVDTLRQDNQCRFGKWLYGPTLTAVDKHSPHFTTVKTLHGRFHEAAARVAELVLAGKKAEATNALEDPNSDFCQVSTQLTSAMMAWKRSL